MKLSLHPFDLRLRHEFKISRSSHRVQETLIVELQDGSVSGFGEATANRYYGVTIDSMTQALEAARSQIQSLRVDDPAEFWQAMHPILREQPFALCALDEAAHDLWGKQRGQPVYRLWGLREENLPATSYTIGIDQIDIMVVKLNERPGWPIYKIKLGTPDDLEIVRELRRHTSAMFRVDANCGWTADETIRNAHEMQSLGVELIEQPLTADRWEDMRRVRSQSPLPVLADESCVAEDDVDRCGEAFDGINIKLVKCGGLTPARRMIARARQLGMQIMVGCMTESTVGISASAQLLPLVDYADIDGALLLAEDIASGVTIESGLCRYSQENGCGVRLLR